MALKANPNLNLKHIDSLLWFKQYLSRAMCELSVAIFFIKSLQWNPFPIIKDDIEKKAFSLGIKYHVGLVAGLVHDSCRLSI